MQKIARFFFLLVLLILSLGIYHAQAQSPETPQFERYQMVELPLAFTGDYKNPYDPDQVEVLVTFDAPNGNHLTVPGFWMQAYGSTCTENCTSDALQVEGEPGWRVRFTPTQIGAWHYTASQRSSGGARNTLLGDFTVKDVARAGFIHVAKNPRYFAYDDGTAYFPVGSDLGWSWSGGGGTAGYVRWLQELHRVGANYGRLYLDVPWFIGLEWKKPVGDYSAAQEDAWRLDTILQMAEQQGVALQIVLEWSQGLASYDRLPVSIPSTPTRPNTRLGWSANPYNLINGGPLNGPAQFFSSETARQLFKRRLRYIAARWGYSTSVFAWELIDQLDRVPTFSPEAASNWLREMTLYLREADAARHLITAGVRDSARAALLEGAELDFRQTHFYQRRPIETAVDQVTGTLSALSPLLNQADRPALLTEFSLNPWFEPAADDPTGVHVRETMWAAALSGAGGSASSAWWDTYLFPQNLTEMFAPLAAFTKSIPWNTSDLRPVSISLIAESGGDYQPIKVTGFNNVPPTQPPSAETVYRLTPDGVVPPLSAASSFLYGLTYSAQYHQPQKYLITPPINTTLTVNVRRVGERAAAKLVIKIDDQTVAQLTLNPRATPASLLVPISAGEHVVTLDNIGADFLQLDSLEVADYVAPLRAVALVDRKAGLFVGWFQHRAYTWENVAKKLEPKSLDFRVRVADMPPGVYQVELWDPFSGDVVGDEMITISGSSPGTLSISLLPITKMLAVRVFKVP